MYIALLHAREQMSIQIHQFVILQSITTNFILSPHNVKSTFLYYCVRLRIFCRDGLKNGGIIWAYYLTIILVKIKVLHSSTNTFHSWIQQSSWTLLYNKTLVSNTSMKLRGLWLSLLVVVTINICYFIISLELCLILK